MRIPLLIVGRHLGHVLMTFSVSIVTPGVVSRGTMMDCEKQERQLPGVLDPYTST